MSEQRSTPREDGFSMPAEWEPHAACLMEWPTLTRGELWGARFEEGKHDYAAVATALGAFEPVVMVCDPDQAAEVRRFCGDGTEILPLPIDDSWIPGGARGWHPAPAREPEALRGGARHALGHQGDRWSATRRCPRSGSIRPTAP